MTDKKILIVMIGLPGSGKSVRAKQLSKKYNATVFSSDAYRELICGDASNQNYNAAVFERLYFELDVALENHKNCILDATNVTLKSRRKIFDNLTAKNRDNCYYIAYVMNTPVSICIQRDKERERTVGEAVINKFMHSYQNPQKFEGFDEIIYDDLGLFISNKNNYYEKEMLNFEQHNPHHIYTLDEHCQRLANYFNLSEEKNNQNTIKYIAGLYHDVGKLFTQSFDENGVAHYYDHANVGTYHLISHLGLWFPQYKDLLKNADDDLNEILFYINYHMCAHQDFRQPKAITRYKKLFGEERFDSLIDFGEKDKLATGTYHKVR